MIPTGLQHKVNQPPVELNVLRLPTPHLEPCLHLADFFFFFFNMGREKEHKKRTKKLKHITYSALSCCVSRNPPVPKSHSFWILGGSQCLAIQTSEQREEEPSVLFEETSNLLCLGPAFYWSPFQGSVLGSFLHSLKES